MKNEDDFMYSSPQNGMENDFIYGAPHNDMENEDDFT